MHSSNINSPVGNPNLAAAKGKSVVFKSAVSALSVLAATSAMVATTVIAAPEVSLPSAYAATSVNISGIALQSGTFTYGTTYVTSDIINFSGASTALGNAGLTDADLTVKYVGDGNDYDGNAVPTQAGKYVVLISFTDSAYLGSKELNLTIAPKDLAFADLDITGNEIATKVYDGTTAGASVEIPVLDASLELGDTGVVVTITGSVTSADVADNATNVLTATGGTFTFSNPNYAAATGLDTDIDTANNTGELAAEITPAALGDLDVSSTFTAVYDGTTIDPASSNILVEDAARTAIPDTDYDVTPSSNINAGEYTAEIVPSTTGNVTGSNTVGYEITKAPIKSTSNELTLALKQGVTSINKDYDGTTTVKDLSGLELGFTTSASNDAAAAGAIAGDVTAADNWIFEIKGAEYSAVSGSTLDITVTDVEITGDPSAANYEFVPGDEEVLGAGDIAAIDVSGEKAEIVGTPKVGETLTVTLPSLATYATTSDFDFAWLDADDNVLGTGASLALTSAHVDKKIRVKLTATGTNVTATDIKVSDSVTVVDPSALPTPPAGGNGGGGGSSTANTISKLDVAKAALTSGASTASSIAKTTKAAIKEVSDDASAAASRTKKLVKAAKTPEAAAAVVTGALAGGDGAEVDAAIAKAAINNATSAKAKAAVIKAIIKATPSKVSPAKTAAKLGKGYGKITVPKSTKQGKTTTVTFKTGYRNGDTVVIYGYQANGKRTKLATGVILNNKVKVSLPKAKGKLTVAAYNVRNGKLIATTSTTEK